METGDEFAMTPRPRLIGQWFLPSGNRCTVARRTLPNGNGVTHFEWWPGHPPGFTWSAEDWAYYIVNVLPTVRRRVREITGRRTTLHVECGALGTLGDLNLAHVPRN